MSTLLPRLVLLAALAAAATALVLYRQHLDPASLEAFVRSLGAWGPVVHVVLFALGTLLFVPGALFGLIGGALFGPLWGTVLNVAGATLGATAAFLAAQYIVGDWVRRRTGPRLEKLVAGVEAEGWRFVALVRLVPLFPFNLTNYALGLTRIPLAQYVLASLVCMVPGTAAYTWLGHAGREALAGRHDAVRYGLLALAALALMLLLPPIIRRMRKAPADWIDVDTLAAELKGGKRVTVVDVRGTDEFTGPLRHIPGAVNIPLDGLERRVGELAALKHHDLTLVCRSDKRSAKAAELLQGMGFGKVRVLRGGMESWHRAGLPVDASVEPRNNEELAA